MPAFEHVAEVGRGAWQLKANYLADAGEAINGYRVTTAQGTLSGPRISFIKGIEGAGIGEALESLVQNLE